MYAADGATGGGGGGGTRAGLLVARVIARRFLLLHGGRVPAALARLNGAARVGGLVKSGSCVGVFQFFEKAEKEFRHFENANMTRKSRMAWNKPATCLHSRRLAVAGGERQNEPKDTPKCRREVREYRRE